MASSAAPQLPPELISQVIEAAAALPLISNRYDRNARYQVLYRSCLVSRIWRDIAQPLLFRHLDSDSTCILEDWQHERLPTALLRSTKTLELSCLEKRQRYGQPLAVTRGLIEKCVNVEEVLVQNRKLYLGSLLKMATNLRVLHIQNCTPMHEAPEEVFSFSLEYLYLDNIVTVYKGDYYFPPLSNFPFLRGFGSTTFYHSYLANEIVSSSIRSLSLDLCGEVKLRERLAKQRVTPPLAHLQVNGADASFAIACFPDIKYISILAELPGEDHSVLIESLNGLVNLVSIDLSASGREADGAGAVEDLETSMQTRLRGGIAVSPVGIKRSIVDYWEQVGSDGTKFHLRPEPHAWKQVLATGP